MEVDLEYNIVLLLVLVERECISSDEKHIFLFPKLLRN